MQEIKGTSSRSCSAPRTRSPRDMTGRLSQHTPEMFRTQTGNMAPSQSSQGPHQTTSLTSGTATTSQNKPGNGDIILMTQQHPSLHNLHSVAADIKDTLLATITDLRIDIQTITGRAQEVEKIAAHQSSAIRQAHHVLDTHILHLWDLNRHMEDLDNRGRHHNLQLRGLPESIETDHIQAEVIGLFNTLFDRPSTSPFAIIVHHLCPLPTWQRIGPPQRYSLLRCGLSTQGGNTEESPHQSSVNAQRHRGTSVPRPL